MSGDLKLIQQRDICHHCQGELTYGTECVKGYRGVYHLGCWLVSVWLNGIGK